MVDLTDLIVHTEKYFMFICKLKKGEIDVRYNNGNR
jgi:hypothetical protein